MIQSQKISILIAIREQFTSQIFQIHTSEEFLQSNFQMEQHIDEELALLASQRSALSEKRKKQLLERLQLCPQQVFRFRQQIKPLDYGIDGLQACYSLYLTDLQEIAHLDSQKVARYKVYLNGGAQKIPLLIQKYQSLMRNGAYEQSFPFALHYTFIFGMLFSYVTKLMDGINLYFLQLQDEKFGLLEVIVELVIIVLLIIIKLVYVSCWPNAKPIIAPEQVDPISSNEGSSATNIRRLQNQGNLRHQP